MDTQAIVAVTLPSADEGDTESLPVVLESGEKGRAAADSADDAEADVIHMPMR